VDRDRNFEVALFVAVLVNLLGSLPLEVRFGFDLLVITVFMCRSIYRAWRKGPSFLLTESGDRLILE